jgi:hypothetical protein
MVDQNWVPIKIFSDEIRRSCVLPYFEVTSFLAAAIGLLGLISLCLLVFGRLGVGSIVAFLVAGIVIGQVRDIPAQTILAVHEFAEIGVVLMLFLIGPEGFRHFVSSMPAPVASGWSESPGGACTHWKAPPCHGAHPKRTLASLPVTWRF